MALNRNLSQSLHREGMAELHLKKWGEIRLTNWRHFMYVCIYFALSLLKVIHAHNEKNYRILKSKSCSSHLSSLTPDISY